MGRAAPRPAGRSQHRLASRRTPNESGKIVGGGLSARLLHFRAGRHGRRASLAFRLHASSRLGIANANPASMKSTNAAASNAISER